MWRVVGCVVAGHCQVEYDTLLQLFGFPCELYYDARINEHQVLR